MKLVDRAATVGAGSRPPCRTRAYSPGPLVAALECACSLGLLAAGFVCECSVLLAAAFLCVASGRAPACGARSCMQRLAQVLSSYTCLLCTLPSVRIVSPLHCCAPAHMKAAERLTWVAEVQQCLHSLTFAEQLRATTLAQTLGVRTESCVPTCLAKLLAVTVGAARGRQTTLSHPKARASTSCLGCNMPITTCWACKAARRSKQ